MSNNGFLEWDSTIEYTGEEYEFTLLETGDYDFEVIELERTTAKNGAPQAVLRLRVHDDEKSTTLRVWLNLQENLVWKLSQFFCSIGRMKKGQKFKMQWDIIGEKGRCKVLKEATDKTDDDGNIIFRNSVDRFYEPLPGDDEIPW